MSPRINPNRPALANIEDIAAQMYAGIHTIQISLSAVAKYKQERLLKAAGMSGGTLFSKYVYVGDRKRHSAVNLNMYARCKENPTYYIQTFSEYRQWFERFMQEFYPGEEYEIERVDVMADTAEIPWKHRRKYDIALMYAYYEQKGSVGDSRYLIRYNNRESSIVVNPNKIMQLASYDRTSKQRDTSGIQGRFEFRILNPVRLMQPDTEIPAITNIGQVHGLLLNLSADTQCLSLKMAEDAAARDIVQAMKIEEADGGRMIGDRKMPDIVIENEFCIFSTDEIALIGKQIGNKRHPTDIIQNIMDETMMMNKTQFQQYVEIVRNSIEKFAKG